MLRLNASVHSWLTRHEKRKQLETTITPPTMSNKMNSSAKQNADTENHVAQNHSADESTLESSTVTLKEATTSSGVGTSIDDCTFNEDLHKQLKNEVGNMYKVWDDADQR